MKDVDDIAIGFARHFDEKNKNLEAHIQASLERALGRFLLKAGLIGIIGGVITVGTTLVTVTRYIDKVEHAIELQQIQLIRLEGRSSENIDHDRSIEGTAISAQRSADVANAKIDGHLAGAKK